MLFYDDRIILSFLLVFFVLLFGGGWELSKLQKSLICGRRYSSLTLFVYRIGRVLLAYICSVYSSHNFVIFIYVLYIKSVYLINSIVGFFLVYVVASYVVFCTLSFNILFNKWLFLLHNQCLELHCVKQPYQMSINSIVRDLTCRLLVCTGTMSFTCKCKFNMYS